MGWGHPLTPPPSICPQARYHPATRLGGGGGGGERREVRKDGEGGEKGNGEGGGEGEW